jgi:phospholipid-translocating ATPase
VLRGTVVRHTTEVTGIVVYTGPDTKIMRNSNVTPSKRSRVDRIVNRSLIVILLMLLALCTVTSICAITWKVADDGGDASWYLHQSAVNFAVDALSMWITALILYNNLVRGAIFCCGACSLRL